MAKIDMGLHRRVKKYKIQSYGTTGREE